MVIHSMMHRKGWVGGGVDDEVEDNNEFGSVKIIDMYRSISYIIRPENDVVDHNSKAIFIIYVSNAEILG